MSNVTTLIKKSKPKPIRYFTQDTEDAIVEYNKTDDSNLKNQIYHERIHNAFFKLTQNIIHTFKFYQTEVTNIEDLQHEVIIFLLSKIHRFDATNGAKAYSFFGTIAKRFLILNNTVIYKKKINKIPIEDIEESEKHSYDMVEIDNPEDKLSYFLNNYIEYCTNQINKLFPKKIDSQIADAILELFRRRENLIIFNKKALYIYIREIIEVKTLKITQIANKLNIIFKTNYQFYLDNGYIKFPKH